MSIIVINPNSNEAVTQGLRDALAPFPKTECITLTSGPFGIENQADSDSVILPMLEMIKSRQDASAFVIACYSDPGLEAAREASPVPTRGWRDWTDSTGR